MRALVQMQRYLLERGEIELRGDIGRAIEPVARAAGASRVYVFENGLDERGRVTMSQRAEWCAPGIAPEIDNPELQDLTYEDNLPRWLESFEREQSVHGAVADLPSSERAILEPQGILAIAVVPFFVGGVVGGFIGFDNCTSTSPWSQAGLELLEGAASTLGIVIERHRAMRAYHAHERRLRDVAEHVREAFWVYELETETFSYVSASIERTLGISPEEFERDGARAIERLEIEDPGRVLCLGAGGHADEREYAARTACGRSIWLRDSIFPVERDGRLIRYVGSLADVTERKQSEQALVLANDELRQARDAAFASSKAKGAFLATMSHELRTPLNAIIGYTELILEDHAEQSDDPEFTEDLAQIQGAGHHLLQLIDQILDFSRIEAGELQIDLRSVDLSELAQGIVDSLRPIASRRGNELRLELGALPEHVETDELRVRQILLNLMGNAIKFTRGGSITLWGEAARGEIVFEVRDTGIGMGPEELERVFNAFAQADSSTTRKFGGAGLGLAISRQLATLLGGALEAESERGVGTTMRLTIPVRGGAEAYR